MAPGYPNPCESFYNCAYNHYFVQQNLYAYFLKQKFDISIQKALLVQYHPDIEGATTSYNEVEVEIDSRMAAKLLESFAGGWHIHVDS